RDLGRDHAQREARKLSGDDGDGKRHTGCHGAAVRTCLAEKPGRNFCCATTSSPSWLSQRLGSHSISRCEGSSSSCSLHAGVHYWSRELQSVLRVPHSTWTRIPSARFLAG